MGLKSLSPNGKRNPLERNHHRQSAGTPIGQVDLPVPLRVATWPNINNRALKELVENMAATTSLPHPSETIWASSKSVDGPRQSTKTGGRVCFPRKWNEEYIDAPCNRRSAANQLQPVKAPQPLSRRRKRASYQIASTAAARRLWASSGSGEALGLEIDKHILSGPVETLHIIQKAKAWWISSSILRPSTENATFEPVHATRGRC